jgi:Membrane carboxypeptidase (penicillin-binding protein)
MRKRDHNIFTNALSLLVCGVLAGVVVAASAFPAVAVGALAAKAGADSFANLPASLEVPTPPQISYLYARDGETLIATFYDENRHDIVLDDVPQVMRDAIIAAEDQRFYEHNGVDVQGVLRAFLANQSSGDSTGQGASTLTMQYVRQALTYGATSPKDVLAATESTPERKIREIRQAVALEKKLTKDQILQNYLNIAAFGNGAYGIYAASQVYFNKEPKDLTLAEAALLAGLPKAPSAFDPTTESGRPEALARRTYVLNQMVELGMISRQQAELADKEPLEVTGTRTPRDCTQALVNHWGFFCDFFYRWWLEQDEFGVDALARASKLKSGGYRITSTLDVGIQDSAKRNVESQLPTGARDALMLTAIQPGTGYVRAMATNRNFSVDDSANPINELAEKAALGIKATYPNTTNPLMSGGGDVVGYKMGSTFKLFTMIAALENGYPLDFTINARSPYVSRIYPAGPTDIARCGDRWCPRNASASMNGMRNMWTGFGLSVNTYFVPLLEKVGAEKAIDVAQRLGIKFRSSRDRDNIADNGGHLWGAFTLGVSDTVPLELANAYATVAADGVYCEPMPVEELIDVHGEPVTDVVEPRCTQAIPVEVARAAADAARCPLGTPGGTGGCRGGTASGIYRIIGHPVIGKTGTADQNWTGTLAVASKHLSIVATVANPDRPETPHGYDQSATLANNAAAYTMRDAHQGLPMLDFERPPQNLIVGVKVAIPDVRCQSEQQAVAAIQRAGFDVYVEKTQKVASPCPPNTVAGTEPSGSTSKGSTVTVLLSAGPGDEPPPPPTGGGGDRRD